MLQEMFYSHFYKQKFIDSLDNEKHVSFYNSIFRICKPLEEQFDKDLYNFTSNEIEILLYSFNTASLSSLYAYISWCRRYVDYAIEHGDRASNINLFKTFTYSDLEQYIVKEKRKYLHDSEVRLVFTKVFNANDYALYLAIYEGISGVEYTELANMTIHDLKTAEKNEVDFKGEKFYKLEVHSKVSKTSLESDTTTRTVTISKLLLNALFDAYYMTEYYASNGEAKSAQFQSRPLAEGDHVFRNVKKSDDVNEKINLQYAYRRGRLLNDISEKAIPNVTTLINSGIIYQMSIRAEDGQLDSSGVLEVAEQFNVYINRDALQSSIRTFARKHAEALKANYDVSIIE